MSDMETQVAEVRLEIHSLLLEIEKFIENLADIAHTALPELVYKYPRHHLNKVQVRDQMCVINSNADHTNAILITHHNIQNKIHLTVNHILPLFYYC